MRRFSAVFPGQASQYVGMGKEFIENIPESATVIEEGEKITSLPLMEKIMKGPMEELTRTLICQPAVFGISMVCWGLLKRRGFSPCSVAGHSLGEYSALVASGVISLEEGFYLVSRRALIMDEVSGNADGGLLAVIGLNVEEVKGILKDFPSITIANINSYKQVVVGGDRKELERFNVFLKENRIKGIKLNVSGPFHTELMREAAERLKLEIDKISFNNPLMPVYLNASGTRTMDRQEIKEGLLKQVYSPVRWVEIMENIYADYKDGVFVEVGPKTVLKKLAESIIKGVTVFNVEDNISLENTIKGLTEDE